MALDPKKSDCNLIKNLLLPLFAISKREKKQVFDRLLTVSTCAIVTEKRNTVGNEIP
jgi:hypothetical protein